MYVFMLCIFAVVFFVHFSRVPWDILSTAPKTTRLLCSSFDPKSARPQRTRSLRRRCRGRQVVPHRLPHGSLPQRRSRLEPAFPFPFPLLSPAAIPAQPRQYIDNDLNSQEANDQ